MVDPATLSAVLKSAAAILTDEEARKRAGWVVAAILSPIIVLFALLCGLLTGAAGHNNAALSLCWYGGTIPADTPASYQDHIVDMRRSFDLLDSAISTVNRQMEDGDSLDSTRVKAVFYALFFGDDSPSRRGHQQCVDCFVTYEERIREVVNEDGTVTTETYTVAVPVAELSTIYDRISTALGISVTPDDQGNADCIYNIILYGTPGGYDGLIDGADVPYIGVDGFCSPLGANWRSYVTSEFGNRRDPFTGKLRGHTGMDLAVPTGTPVRAALPGMVIAARYSADDYGYFVMLDHGGGLVTLYGHCSQLLVQPGQTVEAGDIVSLSGSTGRSTGPHLHFEVRVNGTRTDPRSYLP
ncbi:M23 family metallopeptidase [Pseudoflavonifractor phocaeensis]|uniref:M23 family metallopeptidase n=1 Tax=Pseudoflavonifractor phocaeensis TaxID=1870988 RepID=UPI00210B184A|nr:M23 family metallopeptidase [Pseudoflavonifractor phocaeensis]MCQ4862700.1 M23 family metallopeptidase [Pseudoflavonifractor phocaeensis]